VTAPPSSSRRELPGIPFADYARYYDLLYRDKDYTAETDYVVRTLRAAIPSAHSILEFGSGTGRHGRLLASRGFDVCGIERSSDMVVLANSTGPPAAPPIGGHFQCEIGDARSAAVGRIFDAVIALFHVVSYQTTEDDLAATFTAAARHLAPGGAFLFDVWHGPAVLAQRPDIRVKKVVDDKLEVVRTARPTLDSDRHTVMVTYHMECRDRDSGEVRRFTEDHLVRYLFPREIDSLAASCGLHVAKSEEFVTGRPPSDATWGVAYLLRR
jgi:SAM-dependent methyltransferase